MIHVKSVSSQGMKEANTLAVFHIIRAYRGVSRKTIAKSAHLSPSTVTGIVEDLMIKGIVVEKEHSGSSSHRGRKPVGLFLNTKRHYILALEVQYDAIVAAVFDMELNEVLKISEKLPGAQTEFAGAIKPVLRRLIGEHNSEGCAYLGICIGIHGLVEKRNNCLITSTKAGLFRLNIIDELSDEFKLPIYIDNIANLAGIMERRRYSSDLRSFVYIYADVGVGSCVIIGNHTLSGALGAIPEIGHMSIDMNGRQCSCGNVGCLEQYISVDSLLEDVRGRIEGGEKTTLLELAGSIGNIDENTISEAALSGDAFAQSVIARTANYLGIALANVINIFNPEVIVVSGRLSALGKPLLECSRKKAMELAIDAYCEKLDISLESEPQILRGAAITVLEAQIPSLVLNGSV